LISLEPQARFPSGFCRLYALRYRLTDLHTLQRFTGFAQPQEILVRYQAQAMRLAGAHLLMPTGRAARP
jgi:hypothetical protein